MTVFKVGSYPTYPGKFSSQLMRETRRAFTWKLTKLFVASITTGCDWLKLRVRVTIVYTRVFQLATVRTTNWLTHLRRSKSL